MTPVQPKPSLPSNISSDEYAIIKLKKFNNLEVAIMADKINGGIAVSYEDQHLSAAEQEAVKRELNAIISNEMENM